MAAIISFSAFVMFAIACGGAVHLGLLAFVGLWPRRHRRRAGLPHHSFAILIPAHNEAAGVAQTIQACQELDYPAGKMRILVLADNCDDRTADAALGAGAEVMVRTDRDHPGKGAALRWALSRVLANGGDAVVILDADSIPDARMLRTLDQRLAAGERVLQSAIVFTNADQSATSYLARIGNVIENDFIGTPKARLGLPVFLRGSGMAFARDVFDTVPWNSDSAVEDHEYSLQLLRAGEMIHFVDNARVFTLGADSLRRFGAQRRRWAGALFGAIGNALGLARAGIAQRRWYLIDAAMSQLTMSRPMVLMQLTLTLALGWFTGTRLFAACLWLAAIHCALITQAVIRVGVTRVRLRSVLALPVAVVELVRATLRGVFGVPGGWTRR